MTSTTPSNLHRSEKRIAMYRPFTRPSRIPTESYATSSWCLPTLYINCMTDYV